MHTPLSPKTVLRLHRKFFMLRRPRALSQKSYTLTLTSGKKKPTVALQVANNRSPLPGVLLTVGIFAFTAWLAAKE